MVEKELGERNFGFDSLKSRLNRDMQEKGIVARDCLQPIYNMILFRYRVPGGALWAVVEYFQNMAKSCVCLAIVIHSLYTLAMESLPWPQAAQGHTPTLHLDLPRKTARLWKAHCGAGS